MHGTRLHCPATRSHSKESPNPRQLLLNNFPIKRFRGVPAQQKPGDEAGIGRRDH